MKTDIVFARALAAAAAVGMAMLTARADLIYWMVDENPKSLYSGATVAYDYATIKAGGDGSDPLFTYNDAGSTGEYRLYAEGGAAGPVYSGSFDSTGTDSFLVQLWSEDNSLVGWQTYSYASLTASIWGGSTIPGGSGATPLVVGAVLPEPSSGLLMLVGGALLALRRRRAAF